MWNRNFRQWDPWREMNEIQKQMNHLFDNAYETHPRTFPLVNIWSNNEKVMITAELPGMNKEEIRLSMMNDVLTIEGEMKTREARESETVHRQERRNGPFKRSVELPYHINPEKIKARFEDGILRITLERAEEDKPKTIQIKGLE